MKKFRIISFLLVIALLVPLAVSCDKSKNTGVIKFGDYEAVYTGYEIVKDSEDEDAVVISYNFTNNSEAAESFVWAFFYEIKQGDKELEYAAVWVSEDSYDTMSDSTMEDVAPGETLAVNLTYKLTDLTTPITLNFHDLYNSEKQTQTIDITSEAVTGNASDGDDKNTEKDSAETEKKEGGGFLERFINANPIFRLFSVIFGNKGTSGGSEKETGTDWWLGDWYGWWTIRDGDGYYKDYIGNYWDCAARIEEIDGEYYLTIWDEDYNDYEENCLSYVKLNIDAKKGKIGTASSSGTDNFFWSGNVSDEEWFIDPEAEGYDDTIFIVHSFTDSDGETCEYGVVLNKWGAEWNTDAADTPYYYDTYFKPMFEAGAEVPLIFDPTVMPEVPENNGGNVTVPTDSASGSDKIEANHFTLQYDGSIWKYDTEKDYTNTEKKSHIKLGIPDQASEKDEDIVYAEITVSVEEPYGFRDNLDSYGFDHYEYAVNDSYDKVKIGGIDCLRAESTYWGDPSLIYMNRVEKANTSIFIRIVGETTDERVDALLAGLKINIKDIGHTDGPLYWNGTPFSQDTHTVQVGSNTVKSEWIPFDKCVCTKETFEHKIEIVGDTAYILNDGKLKLYTYKENKLSYVGDVKLDEEYKYISKTEDGTAWFSNFTSPLIAIKNKQMTFSSNGPDYSAMHPSGKWGISWFTSNEVEKITVNGTTAELTKVTLSDMKSVQKIFFDENYIFVAGGTNEEKSQHAVFVYDHNFELKHTLKSDANIGLGSITFAASTDNGFIALDGNMRKVMFWDKDGKVISAVDDSDLFGTDYPWFCGASKLDDGSIVLLLTEEREDKSADEVVAFRLSGF